jgi:hypothetical protein
MMMPHVPVLDVRYSQSGAVTDFVVRSFGDNQRVKIGIGDLRCARSCRAQVPLISRNKPILPLWYTREFVDNVNRWMAPHNFEVYRDIWTDSIEVHMRQYSWSRAHWTSKRAKVRELNCQFVEGGSSHLSFCVSSQGGGSTSAGASWTLVLL